MYFYSIDFFSTWLEVFFACIIIFYSIDLQIDMIVADKSSSSVFLNYIGAVPLVAFITEENVLRG